MKKIIAGILIGCIVFGANVYAKEIESGRVSLGVSNSSQDPLSGIVIAGLYNNGRLLDVKKTSQFVLFQNNSVYPIFDFNSYPSGSEIFAFLWDGFDSMRPLCEKSVLTSATIDAEGYSGEYLLALNTDTTQPLDTGALPKSAAFESFSENTVPFDNKPQKIDVHMPIYPIQKTEKTEQNISLASMPYMVGSTRNFTISTKKSNETNEKYTMEFTCRAVGDLCYIWVATDDIDKDGYTSAEKSMDIVTEAVAQELANEYDNRIFPFLYKNFGYMNDHDGDIRVSLLFYDIQDGFNPLSNRAYTGGYFTNADLHDGYTWSSGNLTDMMHIDTIPQMSITNGIANAKSTIVHEMQHFVNYSWLEISEPTIINKYNQNQSKWTAFNEAMSMAAEHTYGGVLDDRINRYEDNTYNQSIRNGKGFINWEGTLDNYSLSYLFGQYLRTLTFGFNGGGSAIYKSIMNGLPSFDFEGLTSQLNKVMYGNNTGKYMTPNEVIESFRLALILRDDFGPYGFGKERIFDTLKLPLYSGERVTLEPGGAVLVKNSPGFTPNALNPNMKFYGISFNDE